MISSALRRASRCPTTTSATSPLSYSSKAASQCLVSSKCHQRRHSSSKPPIPPNDHPARIATSVKSVTSRPPKTESSKTESSKPETEKRSGAESRLGKRKGVKDSILEEERHEPSLNLPAVPNTNYLHEHDITMASFFACHRPMSVTNSVPLPLAQETFSSIFDSDSKPKHQPAHVISVLGSAIQALERGNQRQQTRSAPQDQQLRIRAQRRDLNGLFASTAEQSSNHNEDTHHLDGNPRRQESVEPQFAATIEQFAQQFRPFRVPPAPEPISQLDFTIVDGEGSSRPSQPSKDDNPSVRQELQEQQSQNSSKEAIVYQAYLTVKEHVSQNGENYFTAHATPLVRMRRHSRRAQIRAKRSIRTLPEPSESVLQVSDRPSTLYRERKQRNRQILAELRRTMHALSVKRQRKLKMKKHKHKKLMRKTRNLRRKLDKL